MGEVIGLRGAIQPPCDVEDPEAEAFVVTVNGDPGNLVIFAACAVFWIALVTAAWGMFMAFSGIFDAL